MSIDDKDVSISQKKTPVTGPGEKEQGALELYHLLGASTWSAQNRALDGRVNWLRS